MANTILLWRGAVEPAESSASGNEYQAWKGAVEPIGASSTTKIGGANLGGVGLHAGYAGLGRAGLAKT